MKKKKKKKGKDLQAIKKVFNKDTYLTDRTGILFHEQYIIVISVWYNNTVLAPLFVNIFKIVLLYSGIQRRRKPCCFSTMNDGGLKKWLNRQVDTRKELAGRAVEALPAIFGSVVGGILNILDKAVGYAAKDTWALIVFVTGFIRYG